MKGRDGEGFFRGGEMPGLESFSVDLRKAHFLFLLSQEISPLFRNQIRSLKSGGADVFLIT